MNWILRSYWSDQKYGTDEKLVARLGAGERVLRGVHCLLDRVGPMLDSRRIAVPPVCDPGHVAGRIHIWRGFTGAVADDAVVEREAAALRAIPCLE